MRTYSKNPPEVYFIDQEEYEAVLESCSDIVHPWVVFLANTGLRASDICSLKWRNCDLKQKTLTVVGTGATNSFHYGVFLVSYEQKSVIISSKI
jgi:integrase